MHGHDPHVRRVHGGEVTHVTHAQLHVIDIRPGCAECRAEGRGGGAERRLRRRGGGGSRVVGVRRGHERADVRGGRLGSREGVCLCLAENDPARARVFRRFRVAAARGARRGRGTVDVVDVAGLAVGLRHEALVEAGGALAAASTRWKRALSWWFLAVLVALVVLGLRYLPGDADHAVTRWLPGAAGRTDGTDLYVDAAPLLEYPPPWWAVRELFVLRTLITLPIIAGIAHLFVF